MINYKDDVPASMDVVAPRSEQPVAIPEWPGHSSSKFLPAKKHVPCPQPTKSDISVNVPLGRAHYPAKMDQ